MKNYEITEEQIKNNSEKTLKEWFLEVFEAKLEVGKWYKWKDNSDYVLWFITKIEKKVIYSYGFFNDEFIENKVTYSEHYYKEACYNLKPATDSEVLEALTNEFKKQNPNIGFNYFRFKDNVLLGWNLTEIAYELFKNGIWTKFHTKEEAGKLLNAKII